MATVEILSDEKGKKGKIVSFEPIMKNGEHDSYDSKFGKQYKFLMTFDNGDIGVVASTKTEPSWKKDTEYIYNFTKKKIADKYFSNSISGLKLAEGGYKGGGYTTKSAEEWKSHAMQVAISLSSKLIKDTVIDVDKLTSTINVFYKWILNRVNNNDNLYWRAFSVLESACNICSATGSMKEIFNEADKFFNLCNIQKKEEPKHVPQPEPVKEVVNELPSFIAEEDEELPF